MKIVIELSDETYRNIKEENGIYGVNNGLSARITGKVVGAIQNGTPFPKKHGRLVDADKILIGVAYLISSYQLQKQIRRKVRDKK